MSTRLGHLLYIRAAGRLSSMVTSIILFICIIFNNSRSIVDQNFSFWLFAVKFNYFELSLVWVNFDIFRSDSIIFSCTWWFRFVWSSLVNCARLFVDFFGYYFPVSGCLQEQIRAIRQRSRIFHQISLSNLNFNYLAIKLKF